MFERFTDRARRAQGRTRHDERDVRSAVRRRSAQPAARDGSRRAACAPGSLPRVGIAVVPICRPRPSAASCRSAAWSCADARRGSFFGFAHVLFGKPAPTPDHLFSLAVQSFIESASPDDVHSRLRMLHQLRRHPLLDALHGQSAVPLSQFPLVARIDAQIELAATSLRVAFE